MKNCANFLISSVILTPMTLWRNLTSETEFDVVSEANGASLT